VFLIEHDMNVVMGISDWISVMDGGKKIAEGLPRQIYHDRRVIEASEQRVLNMPPILSVSNLSVRYGALEALKGVSLSLEEGEVMTVLGANGAGKSTRLRSISGILPVQAGEIRFLDAPLQRTPPYDIVLRGISHAAEGRKVFSTLAVEENLNLGAFTRRRRRNEVTEARERVFGLFPILSDRRRQLAGTLSGGEQQMLAMAGPS